MEKSMSMAESAPAKDPQISRSPFLDLVARVRREQAAATRPTTEKKLKNPFRILGTLKRGEFGNVDEGDMKSLIAKRTALSVGPSVVGLTSRAGDEFLLNCSGFVIDRNDVIATIITSASLVIGDEDSIPNNITVKVHLPNHDTVSGSVSQVDLHHNIATIIVSASELRAATLLPYAKPFTPGKNVVALGRHARSFNLLAYHGELKHKDYDFDSEDVLSSGCKITHYGIGGPLVDISSGLVIGMCFSDMNCTVFLPSTIVLRCLKHFKSYGKVYRPWLGMRTQILDTLKMTQLETIHQKFSDLGGIFVKKVIKGSPADCAGVCPGDIVTHCDGIPICSPLEFAEILFDKAEQTMYPSNDRAIDYAVMSQKITVEVAIRSESSGGWGVKNIIVDRLSPPEFNRWPLRRSSGSKVRFH
ncbi:unnamed protein product [Amaranthus hypochondriacus]